jgi:hypothetical protein
MSPTFSPDGRFLAYFTPDAIWRLDVTQGSPVRVDASTGAIVGATWTDDDRLIFSRGFLGGLSSIPAAGGEVAALTEPEAIEVSHRYAHAIPGTTHVLVRRMGGPTGGPTDGIWMLDTATDDVTERWTWLTDGVVARYADGILFFLRGGTLYGQRFDAGAGTLAGDPVPLLDDMNPHHALSETGTLVHLTRVPGSNVEVAGIGVAAAPERLMLVDLTSGDQTAITPQPADFWTPMISPDGARVAVPVSTSGVVELMVYDLATGAPQPLGPMRGWQPLWSADPDSSALVFQRGESVVRLDLASGDPPRELFPASRERWPGDAVPRAWTLGGDLIFSAPEIETQHDLLVFRTDGEIEVYRQNREITAGADLSRIHGRVIFEESPAPEEKVIYVTTAPYPDNRGVPISGIGALGPRWAPDGRSIYFVEGSELVEVPLDSDGDAMPEQRRTIFRFGIPHNSVTPPFDIHPDGDRIVVVDAIPAPAPEIMVITDWVESVRHLLR